MTLKYMVNITIISGLLKVTSFCIQVEKRGQMRGHMKEKNEKKEPKKCQKTGKNNRNLHVNLEVTKY